MGDLYWWNGSKTRRRTASGPPRPSTFVPSFPAVETSYWKMYGWQTLGALLAGAVGALGWIFYARSLVVFGSGAFLYFAMFSVAIMCGVGLPIRYYRHYKMFRRFDAATRELPSTVGQRESIRRRRQASRRSMPTSSGSC